ncbi:MAG: cyclodeaminase/cyclohydrolase family protein [Planctomycetota bacterium]
MSTIASESVGQFLAALAERSPAPGGGAAAGLVGATACSLASMVVAYSVGKASLAQHSGELNEASGVLARTRALFLELAERDSEAFAEYSRIKQLPEGSDERSELESAARAVIEIPMAALRASTELGTFIERLVPITNANLRSDAEVAGVLAEASAASAACNVRVNLPLVEDADERAKIETRVAEAVAEAAETRRRIETACRGG